MGLLEGQTTVDWDTAGVPVWAPKEMNQSTPECSPGRFRSQDICANSLKTLLCPIPTPCSEEETEAQRQMQLLYVTLWAVGVQNPDQCTPSPERGSRR